MSRATRVFGLLGWGALLVVLAGPATAWTDKTQLAIADYAASVAPIDLQGLLERHQLEFRRGVVAPFRDGDPSRHVRNPNGSGRVDQVIQKETEKVIRAIRQHYPFRDIVYQMGVVAHYVADANNPLNTADSDPHEKSYARDYLRYVEGAQARFAVVLIGYQRMIEEPEDLTQLLNRALDRGRLLYPAIGDEYRRVGAVNGRELFDDRSTAFGVGSVAFNHALSDIVGVLRYIWIRAGGADRKSLFPLEKDHLVLLAPGAQDR